MAEELDPAEGLPGGEDAPTDTVVENAADVVIEQEAEPADPIEALAAKMGWAPKDKFRGEPDDWKPADEFIIAGKDIQRNLSKDLKGLKDTVANMSRTSATLLEQQLAERDAYWQAKKREAVDLGDYEAVEHADEQRKAIEQQRAPLQPSIPPEGEDFAKRHASWFNVDREATNYAISRADHYAKQGLSAARQLAAVEQDMRGIFPDLFAPPAKPAPQVARPGSRAASTSGRKKSFHDLPAEAQAVARDMHDRLGIPVETYVTNYFKEKVG